MIIYPEDTVTESLIEKYLVDDPMGLILKPENIFVTHWIKRQYQLPNGRLDLLGQLSNGDIAVVEIKNVTVGGDAIAQVCRYAYDIRVGLDELREINVSAGNTVIYIPNVRSIVVGPAFTDMTVYAAEALNVSLIQFDLNFMLGFSYPAITVHGLTERKQKRLDAAYDILVSIQEVQESELNNGEAFNLFLEMNEEQKETK